MAAELHRTGFPAVAASQVAERAVVTLGGRERGVLPVATRNVLPYGITVHAASAGVAVAVLDRGNYAKVLAAASLGAGAETGVASTNGAVGPISGASGAVAYSVGQSVEPSAAGEYFVLYVNPRQLSGLV